MGGQVGKADMEKRVVYGVVAVVADKRAHMPLRVVILGGIETVVDKNHAAAHEFFGKGADKGVLGGV